MANGFVVNTHRFDPYKNYKFQILWDNKVVLGVSKISALKRTTEVVEHRVGGDSSTSRKSPGRSKFEPIMLERGVTHDPEFEAWANLVWNVEAGLGAEVSLANFRKDIIIEMYNEAGQLAIAYKVFRCWVSDRRRAPSITTRSRSPTESRRWCTSPDRRGSSRVRRARARRCPSSCWPTATWATSR